MYEESKGSKSIIEKYSDCARKWDEWYSSYYGLKRYQHKAVRVEQGEYAVVSLDIALGTYNVHQCVVLYFATDKLHGLAHIDGHTEIKSLRFYLLDLGIDNNKNANFSYMKIIGAKSTNVMGLNDSEANINKVVKFLKGFFGEQGSYDIDSLASTRQYLTDFVIEWSIDNSEPVVHDRTLALGDYSRVQALHTIQEIKRKDGYLGTYPIARANDGHSNCVFLDERAIVKLHEYLTPQDKCVLGGQNSSAFNAAIPVILYQWRECIKNLSENIRTSTPLFIGDGSIERNSEIFTFGNQYSNSANINLVLEYCRSIDSDLKSDLVKQQLFAKYKQNTVANDYDIFGFDAAISAKSLISVILEYSHTLGKLLMLNSQGGCDLDNKFYKILDIKATLSYDEIGVLARVIEQSNQNIQYDLTSDETYQQISMQFQFRGVRLNRQEKIILSQKQNTYNEAMNGFCTNHNLDPAEVRQSIEARCNKVKIDKTNASQITDESKFASVQQEFLNALDPKPAVFSSTTIGMHLSECADDHSYVYDQNFGHKLSTLIGADNLGSNIDSGV